MGLQDHNTWKFARPLLGEAVVLLLVYSVAVALASASNLGRPGSGYPGYLFFLAVVGALMVYHHSPARRAVCFVALLLALVGLDSEKSSGDAWSRTKHRLQTEQMRRGYEQALAEREGAASTN